MTVNITVRAMNAATAILRPCDSLAAAMDGYSPKRSGSDLLMQSAGLLIICHMREETSEQPTNFTHNVIVEDCFIGRIGLTPSIVGTVKITVKPRASVRKSERRASTLGFEWTIFSRYNRRTTSDDCTASHSYLMRESNMSSPSAFGGQKDTRS